MLRGAVSVISRIVYVCMCLFVPGVYALCALGEPCGLLVSVGRAPSAGRVEAGRVARRGDRTHRWAVAACSTLAGLYAGEAVARVSVQRSAETSPL